MTAVLSPFGTVGVGKVIAPSNDSSGVTDLANINAGLANGGAVQLLPATLNNPYFVNGPILPTSQSRLWGAYWWSASANDSYGAGPGASGGTTIFAVGTQALQTGIIQMVNPSSSVQNYGVDLAGFTIEGFSTGGTGVDGIHVEGAWGAGFIRGVTVHRPDQNCLSMSVSGASGKVPDSWTVTDSKFSASRNARGVFLPNCPDSTFIGCESSENTLENWGVGACVNTGLTKCRGENSGNGQGFRFYGAGAGQQITLNQCTTNLNALDGFLFDNSGAGSTSRISLANCHSQNDNQNAAAGIAGFRSNAFKGSVMGVGCSAIGAQQKFGASQVAISFAMTFTGSFLTGLTTPTNDDASNTHALVNQSPVAF